MTEFKQLKFPSQGRVFDYFLDHKTKKWLPWSEKIPKFERPLQSVIVHTAETTCLHYFLDLLVANRHAGGRSRLRQDHHDQRQVLQARRGYSGHDHPFQQLHHFAHAPADHGETPGEEGRAQLRSPRGPRSSSTSSTT